MSANQTTTVKKHRIYTISFASVYPHYVAKAEKKGRTKAEVDACCFPHIGQVRHAGGEAERRKAQPTPRS
jgi:hypothetical protein